MRASTSNCCCCCTYKGHWIWLALFFKGYWNFYLDWFNGCTIFAKCAVNLSDLTNEYFQFIGQIFNSMRWTYFTSTNSKPFADVMQTSQAFKEIRSNWAHLLGVPPLSLSQTYLLLYSRSQGSKPCFSLLRGRYPYQTPVRASFCHWEGH